MFARIFLRFLLSQYNVTILRRRQFLLWEMELIGMSTNEIRVLEKMKEVAVRNVLITVRKLTFIFILPSRVCILQRAGRYSTSTQSTRGTMACPSYLTYVTKQGLSKFTTDRNYLQLPILCYTTNVKKTYKALNSNVKSVTANCRSMWFIECTTMTAHGKWSEMEATDVKRDVERDVFNALTKKHEC